ncbi:MAG: SGNH/GDSL hydrolase family protein [Solirubrobacterales bacterium]|nr:SGNH/GDSL hydrolase family protein [Solirubrobacterales bacterium]
MKNPKTPLLRTGLLLVSCALALGGCFGSDPGDDSAQPATPETPVNALPVTPVDAGWKDDPVIPDISGKTKKQFLKDVAKADSKGLRPDVFAKAGDSNTEVAPALYGLACRRARLPGNEDLRKVIARYNRVRLPNSEALPGCRPSTSFSRRSAAARRTTLSYWPSETRDNFLKTYAYGDWGLSPECKKGDSPLRCEVRFTRPRYVFILAGTNDFGLDASFGLPPGRDVGSRLALVVKQARELGTVPVLSTIPPEETKKVGAAEVNRANAAIAGMAHSEGVPLINLWRALDEPQMINHGLGSDGLHLGTKDDSNGVIFPGPEVYADSVDFTPEGLRYGANRRNLIWLQTLKALDAAAGSR